MFRPFRAPKTGQRNFYPGCRKKISKKYASQDFRQRRGQKEILDGRSQPPRNSKHPVSDS
jgi:hypothetical protein